MDYGNFMNHKAMRDVQVKEEISPRSTGMQSMPGSFTEE